MGVRTHLLATFGVAALITGAAYADHHESPVEIGGELGAYYSYNFNRPASGGTNQIFNTEEGQFRLLTAELSVRKKFGAHSGVLVRLIDGDIARAILDSSSNNATTRNVLEAYLESDPSAGWHVKVGQFVSPFGLETVSTGAMPFLSRSNSYALLQNVFAAGIIATRDMGDQTSVSGILQNRFKGVEDTGNRDVTFGGQVVHKLGANQVVKVGFLSGRENLGTISEGRATRQQTGGINRQSNLVNGTLTGKLADSGSYGLDLNWRGGKDLSNRNYNVTGIAAYLTRAMAGNLVGLRGEYLSQNNATSGILPQASGSNKKPNLASITLSYELKSGMAPGVRTILEYRIDRAHVPVFAGRTGAKKDQSTLSVAQVFSF